MKTLRNLRLGAAALVAAAALQGCGWESIPPGSVGVKFNANSGISHHILKPEVVFVAPFTERLLIYPTNIRNASYVRNSTEGDRKGDDSIKAITKEGAILPMDVTVAFRIGSTPADIQHVFNTFGTKTIGVIQEEYIRWATQVAVNDVSGQMSIFDLMSKDRSQVGPDIKKALTPITEPWGVYIDNVYVREVFPAKEITEKIHEQQQARAALETARIEQKQAKVEAQTAQINAEKEAAQNKLLAAQGDTALALKKLERRRKFIEKWDGVPPVIGTGIIPKE